jgi:hypothetical protein
VNGSRKPLQSKAYDHYADLVCPASGAKLVIDKATMTMEDYLNFGKEVIGATLNGSEKSVLGQISDSLICRMATIR